MHKIVIKTDSHGGTISQSRLKLALHLSRLLNVIRSNQRSYLRIENDSNPANRRDRLELILYQGAIVFEAVKAINSHVRELRSLGTWIQQADRLKRIQYEQNGKTSFTNQYLRLVRNKILFHYDFATLDKVSDFYPLPDNIEFASSSTEKTIDLAFILADTVLLNYLIDRINEPISDADKWGLFEEKLIGISADLTELLDGFVFDLLGDYISIETDKE